MTYVEAGESLAVRRVELVVVELDELLYSWVRATSLVTGVSTAAAHTSNLFEVWSNARLVFSHPCPVHVPT